MKPIVNIILYLAFAFIALMSITMLFAANVNNLTSFVLLVVSAILLLPAFHRKIAVLLGKNINTLIYVFVSFVFLMSGVLIGAGTEQQVKKAEANKAIEAKQAEVEKEEERKKREQIEKEKAKKKAEAEKAKAERKAEVRRKKDTSKGMLTSKCRMAVEPNLKNPNSMKVDYSKTQVGTLNDGLGVDLYYYAQNGFGATVINFAQCKFDNNGALISVDFE